MKRLSPWTVENEGILPNGDPNRCFHCNQPKGTEHQEACVIRNRTVVVRFFLDLVVPMPEHWNTDMIEYKYNESSWCGDNIITILYATMERIGSSGCLCHAVKAEFVREATSEDEKSQQLFAEMLKG